MKEDLSFSQFYEDVDDAYFKISETCVDVSKCHITAEEGIVKIRGLLKPLDRYLLSTSSFAPSVDAVEVVRCKDCKHWTRIYTKWHCDIHFNVGHAEFYCADGERREDA